MFASSSTSLARRRGIVLVVVLGMLGLMALIGVTFATFAGQSLIASRNFNQGVARPQPEALMDYALAQLINDTNNPTSAIRGHSLLRDMYGNDSVFRGANPTANPAAETKGVLSSVYNKTTGTYVAPQFTSYKSMLQSTNGGTTAFYGQYQYATNIPTQGQYYGLDFTRWLVRITNNGVPQTFEILEDDTSTSVHLFTLAANLVTPTLSDPTVSGNTTSGDWTSFIYYDPNLGATVNNNAIGKAYTSLSKEVYYNGTLTPAIFTLDGRYMRAFNGSGATQSLGSPANPAFPNNLTPYNQAALANFRVTGFNPDSLGMDEDYDACDLENWFLAIQSADGQVVVPSFHRPGILTGNTTLNTNAYGVIIPNDWTYNPINNPVSPNNFPGGNPKILRPRLIDNSPLFPPDPSTPDPTTGKLTYDIDNDGDGITDSVWLDLGYSVQRDPGGKLYKPLFAFMVLGLNGRLPLNTVGNLQARATGDQTNTVAASGTTTGGETLPNGTVLGPSSLNSTPAVPPSTMPTPGQASATTQVPYPGPLSGTTLPDSQYFLANYSSQVYNDSPLWDHTSHLGYSVNEINPKFALQNAPSNLYPSTSGNVGTSIYGVYPAYSNNVPNSSYSQYDNVGVSVALTQLRNILAGTTPVSLSNYDQNQILVNGQSYTLPNNVADSGDYYPSGITYVARGTTAVAGRWGEAAGVPLIMYPAIGNTALYSGGPPNVPVVYPMYWYNNPVRAGRSAYTYGSIDAMDDDYDALDPHLPTAAESGSFTLMESITGGMANQYQIPLNYTTTPYNSGNPGPPFTRNYPEFVDLFDPTGQMAIASERMRRFTTPIDTAGVGRVVDHFNRPNNDHDYGKGYDSLGRTSYFRYFRPAGMPQEIRYPYPTNSTTMLSLGAYPATYPYITNSGLGQQYLMPVLLPAGKSSNPLPNSKSDRDTNRYHGFQSALTPTVNLSNTQMVAAMGAMPYDWDMFANSGSSTPGTPTATAPTAGTPTGYGTTNVMTQPTIGPPATSAMYVQSSSAVNLLAPTIQPMPTPLLSSVNTSWGPNLNNPVAGVGGTTSNFYIVPKGTFPQNYELAQYLIANNLPPVPQPSVVNGFLGSVYNLPGSGSPYITGGSLNVDEADEMNLYSPNMYDQPYGPSDLEWLYRLQDVDGATLTSRLSQLAPVSFLNPADGLTRRRLFSTDSWELNRFVWANDNPQGSFPYNSRFLPAASPSLEILNQAVAGSSNLPLPFNNFNVAYANPIATEFLPNPTFPAALINTNHPFIQNNIGAVYQNGSQVNGNPTPLPMGLTPNSNGGLFSLASATAYAQNGVVVPYSIPSLNNPVTVQVQTPSVAHGDRKINLNFPLPISNDPAEPVRQKWCRETYQLLKAILPPASIDTPEELAQLSQFVVNILDFRDTDCTMTRFVNTDLQVTDVLTKQASNVTPPGTGGTGVLDTTWTVSPAGVAFSTTNIPTTHFPYDPSLYSPDAVTPFLVQHGMEYNPIAINEVLAYSAPYGSASTGALSTYQAFFIELVNTLTEELNNAAATSNASAISLLGWDIIVTPDDFGWGRPDPISGDVNQIALPPWTPISATATPAGDPTLPPIPYPAPPARTTQRQWAGTADPNLENLYSSVQQFIFTTNGINPTTGAAITLPNPVITAISKTGTYNPFIIGDYRDVKSNTTANANPSGIGAYVNATTGWSAPNSNVFEGSTTTTPASYPVVTTNSSQTPNPTVPPATAGSPPTLNVKFPPTFALPTPPLSTTTYPPTTTPAGTGKGRYYWVYLRRPANPFDTTPANEVRPNKEMVVVDCMRFAAIDAGNVPGGTPSATVQAPTQIYSTQRLQPYRGGHLIRTDTAPPSGLPHARDSGDTSPINGVTTICPPNPSYAYGYSEQTAVPPSTGNVSTGIYQSGTAAIKTTQLFRESINAANTTSGSSARTGTNPDAAWCNMPINDRDFTSVAELLLVPGCPPGLFTKQFVEEQYPGNIFANSATYPTPANTALGTDLRDLSTAILAYSNNSGTATGPLSTGNTNPSLWGRQNFNTTAANLPANPSFPYLPDNFYYTAASVAPPSNGQPNSGVSTSYTSLTTEIGGWTGAGWHKMLEFFEVPSSANGAIGTADYGNNYDWQRADVKPGLINLNLIIDEEVFAGLLDDGRLNETLANATAAIPAVVSQVDGNGYPVYDNSPTSPTYGHVYGAQPMFSTPSVNPFQTVNANGGTAMVPTVSFLNQPTGRGYALRDSNILDQQNGPNGSFVAQQVHGMKAAFADFLKLRHGGSGFLFAFGNGPTGSGDYPTPPNTPNNVNANSGFYPLILNYPTGSPIENWPYLTLPLTNPTQPIASDRPYRSLSFPDINFTVMRPASLPPSPVVKSSANLTLTPGTTPPLPVSGTALASGSTVTNGLENLLTYGVSTATNPTFPYIQLQPFLPPMNQGPPRSPVTNNTTAPYQYIFDPGLKNPYLPIQFANAVTPDPAAPTGPKLPLSPGSSLAPPYGTNYPVASPAQPGPAPFPAPIPPTPAMRLFQVPDHRGKGSYTSNASVGGQVNTTAQTNVNAAFGTGNAPADQDLSVEYTVNEPIITLQLSTGVGNAYTLTTTPTFPGAYFTAPASTLTSPSAATSTSTPPWPTTYLQTAPSPPHLVLGTKSFFLPDNVTPTFASTLAITEVGNTLGIMSSAAPPATVPASPAQNHLGSGSGYTSAGTTNDYRQHPLYRTEWLQKVMNLTTVRTHQFAVWITIGFFEVVKQGTPELGVPDVLGQELGVTSGRSVRYRSFFVLDRTKATGFNPYHPGNFRDCVTYRRRIE